MSLAALAALAILLQAPPPPAAAAAAPAREAVVVAAVENMYSAPSDAADVVSQATLGQTIAVLEAWGSFLRVRTPDAYEGWLPASAAVPYAARDARRYARDGRVAEVTSLMANVYREPDVTSAKPLVLAPLATRIEVTGDGPGTRWLAVRLPGGGAGFIQKGDVRAVDPAAAARRGTPDELVATARRFLGVPYLWGGMSAHGVDCSGFVSQVYRANGVVLPRDADLQFADPNASPVDREALQPGDLVFFGRDDAHISHVGMSLGGARFVNATTHEVPVVREDSLDDPHWSSIYRGARRPR